MYFCSEYIIIIIELLDNRFSFLIVFIGCLWIPASHLNAQLQVAPDRFRIEFTDKNHNSFSVEQPQYFLSERALQRRARQGIRVTQADLPVSAVYIDSLRRMGIEVLNSSRWLNSATIRCSPEALEKLLNIDFIKRTSVIHRENIAEPVFDYENTNEFSFEYDEAPAYYGRAAAQTGMVNGQALHERGFRGQGMLIAIIDAGFYNVNELSGFESLHTSGRLHGYKNFTPDTENPLGNSSHGTNVLSILATYLPDQMVGSAPEADYLLLRSEEIEHEFLVEEDNWIVAVEYADSIGADIINTSLGYTRFGDPSHDHHRSNLDGRAIRTSRAATMAAARGIIVCVSAGNEGVTSWRTISVPADADSIIAVGAVYPNGQYAEFSSVGPAADNRIKPDLMALGASTAYQNAAGYIAPGSGTSYSTPVLTGLIACLWQAYPEKTNMEIIEMVKRSASHFHAPNPLYGYGIPDFSKLINRTKKQ